MRTVVSLKNRHNHIVACANGFAFAQHEADNGAISGSKTPGGTFPATSVEMNADDAGSVRPICDGSSLDKIEIAIVFPSQEKPIALSLRTGFTQEFFFKDFAGLKGEVLFLRPSSGGRVIGRTFAPGFQRSSNFASPMSGIDDDDGRSFQCSGDAEDEERSFVWFNNFTLHNILPADFKVIEHGLDIDPPILAVQIPNSRSTQENGDAFGG